MKGQSVSISASVVRIWPPAASSKEKAGHVDQPTSVLIKHPSGGSGVLYVGGSDVNNTGPNIGFALSPGESLSVDLIQDAIYGIASSGTHTVYVLASN
jgi:hypothetical protein